MKKKKKISKFTLIYVSLQMMQKKQHFCVSVCFSSLAQTSQERK